MMNFNEAFDKALQEAKKSMDNYNNNEEISDTNPPVIDNMPAIPAIFLGVGTAQVKARQNSDGTIEEPDENLKKLSVVLLFEGPGNAGYPLCISRETFNKLLQACIDFDEILADRAAKGLS